LNDWHAPVTSRYGRQSTRDTPFTANEGTDVPEAAVRPSDVDQGGGVGRRPGGRAAGPAVGAGAAVGAGFHPLYDTVATMDAVSLIRSRCLACEARHRHSITTDTGVPARTARPALPRTAEKPSGAAGASG